MNAYTNIDAADNKAKQRTKSWSENLTWAFGACELKSLHLYKTWYMYDIIYQTILNNR